MKKFGFREGSGTKAIGWKKLALTCRPHLSSAENSSPVHRVTSDGGGQTLAGDLKKMPACCATCLKFKFPKILKLKSLVSHYQNTYQLTPVYLFFIIVNDNNWLPKILFCFLLSWLFWTEITVEKVHNNDSATLPFTSA